MISSFPFREQWLYHRQWIIILCGTLLLLLIEPFASKRIDTHLSNTLSTLGKQQETLEKLIDQWNQDALTATSLDGTISEKDVQRHLAPFNQTIMVQRLESVAASARLFNITTTLSTPKEWQGTGLFTGIEGIDERTLKLEADAPMDSDVLDFLDSLDQIDGKLDLENLTITPLPRTKPLSLGALNVHISATFRWLTNSVAAPEVP